MLDQDWLKIKPSVNILGSQGTTINLCVCIPTRIIFVVLSAASADPSPDFAFFFSVNTILGVEGCDLFLVELPGNVECIEASGACNIDVSCLSLEGRYFPVFWSMWGKTCFYQILKKSCAVLAWLSWISLKRLSSPRKNQWMPEALDYLSGNGTAWKNNHTKISPRLNNY